MIFDKFSLSWRFNSEEDLLYYFYVEQLDYQIVLCYYWEDMLPSFNYIKFSIKKLYPLLGINNTGKKKRKKKMCSVSWIGDGSYLKKNWAPEKLVPYNMWLQSKSICRNQVILRIDGYVHVLKWSWLSRQLGILLFEDCPFRIPVVERPRRDTVHFSDLPLKATPVVAYTSPAN